MKHLLEICRNAERSKLAYMSPCDENGNPKDGYRISGSKPWGGSKKIADVEIYDSDLIEYIKSYAIHIIPELT